MASDSLRDRIAAVIDSIRIQRDGDSYKMADAVIAELEMQVGASALFLVDDKKVIHNRYTTKWVADE